VERGVLSPLGSAGA